MCSTYMCSYDLPMCNSQICSFFIFNFLWQIVLHFTQLKYNQYLFDDVCGFRYEATDRIRPLCGYNKNTSIINKAIVWFRYDMCISWFYCSTKASWKSLHIWIIVVAPANICSTPSSKLNTPSYKFWVRTIKAAILYKFIGFFQRGRFQLQLAQSVHSLQPRLCIGWIEKL